MTTFLDAMRQPKPTPVAMPAMSTPTGAGALDAYRAAICGTATVKPATVVAAETWVAGMAVIAAAEAAQLAEFHAAAAQRQPVVDDSADARPTRSFLADVDGPLQASKSAAEAQRLADSEATLAEEQAERQRRFNEWTPEANPPRSVMVDEA